MTGQAPAVGKVRDSAMLLGANGPFAARDASFRPRRSQQAMAEAIDANLASGGRLIVEAGTGTGKTFAYLVPALLAGGRIIVSTGTKTLQDQLFLRDLPVVRDALSSQARLALLKGRANYLCLYRLQRASTDNRLRPYAPELHRLSREAESSRSGGGSGEVGDLDAGHPLLARVTSTTENCLGSRCPDFADCFVVRARRLAQAADVVVVNHHLLLADYSLKQEGFGEILPGADAVIIDEAHQLPDLAAQFFGSRLSSGQLIELIRDSGEEAKTVGAAGAIRDAGDELAAAVAALEEVVGGITGRLARDQAMSLPGFASSSGALEEALISLTDILKDQSRRSPGIAGCAERATALLQRWRKVNDSTMDVANEADIEAGAEAETAIVAEKPVRWIEPLSRGLALHATPISVAEGFRRFMALTPGAWIFTSATLSASADFTGFRQQLGLEEAQSLKLESAFDYPSQARLHLPGIVDDPGAATYPETVADTLRPLIEASGGGAFILCTSHRALVRIANRLRTLPFPLLMQGDDDKAVLLQRFTAAGNAVLVGTASFWEGVDVRGPALRLVAIDRLPFAAPGDPVQEAKLTAIRNRGGSPFAEEQLPRAIMLLRQGAGRLIRDVGDRGLLVLCDPRLRSRSYGRGVLRALPPMPQVDTEEALAWARALPRPTVKPK